MILGVERSRLARVLVTSLVFAVFAAGGPGVAQASCDRDDCARKCERDCEAGTAGWRKQPGYCRNNCETACRDETACENRLGYREQLHGGGHLAYGLGGAFHPEAIEPGFRHHLELAAAIGPAKKRLSRGSSISSDNGGLATVALLHEAKEDVGLLRPEVEVSIS